MHSAAFSYVLDLAGNFCFTMCRHSSSFLLLLALQPTVGFSLLIDFLPFCPFFTLLAPTVLLPLFANLLQYLQSISSVVSL